jgi:uncharacterized protein YdeI (YjbR/CyaY-like superfamily)
MARKDPRVDDYIAKAQPFAKPRLKHIRKVVHIGCPEVSENIKWGVPAFEYKGPMCGMAAFKQYCTFGFWKHALLAGTERTQNPLNQFGRLTSIDDLPSERTLVSLVKQAATLNDEGVKLPRAPRAPKPPAKVPPDLAKALKSNRKAQAAFEAFSPSHRREYIEWITEAKQEATRQRRLETAIKWIAEGKGRNWKYQ